MKTDSQSFKCLWILILLLSFAVYSPLHSKEETPIHVQRLSDRVIVLTEQSPMENIIVALASNQGLIVVDTLGSFAAATRLRKAIEKEFGREDIAYVINTHHHWDHTNGNAAFSDAIIIGHEGCSAVYGRIRQAVSRSKEQKSEEKKVEKGKEMEAESSESELQTITFKDRMTLDLGDLTLNLVFFGRAHSGSDIFIQVPEEGLLMTGDLFLERGWLPLFSGQIELDVPLWIDVLNSVLDDEIQVKHVIPGHTDIWNREKLAMWRDYIVNLWEGLVSAEAEGLKLEEAEERFPFDQKFSYLKEIGHSEADLQRFHKKNIHAFWRQLKESASILVETTIKEAGIKAAVDKYYKLKSDPSEEYFFDETSFNMLGYKLLYERKVLEAIEVFKLNVEAYPDSWNVYDSLGEAYMIQGNKELAIKNYKKSLELNPKNNNAIRMLQRIKEKK